MTEMMKDLQEDSSNLARECFAIVERVKQFVYPTTDVFIIEEYGRFLQEKNTADLKENLRSLANKTHGLKGIVGFVYPQVKELVHESERLIKPLAAAELLLDHGMYVLLREFFLRVREFLDFNQGTLETLAAEGWAERFAGEEKRVRAFIRNNELLIKHMIEDRSEDLALVRRRPPSATIAVSRDGYERLLVLASQLHQLAGSTESNTDARAEALLSEFLQIHQANKLNPLDLSRYERVVPKLAAQYGLRATFEQGKLNIRGEDKFLGAVHEITNHIVKNAITHAFEPPEVRKALGKDPSGSITFSGEEDALSYYITIADDGKGIDLNKVADKAVSLGLVRREALATMPQGDILRLIFAQGLTTAQKVDDNAGRGVGLNAVQELLDKFLGTVDVQTTAGKGTTWKFRFQKTDVALPCMIVETHGSRVAIPEHSVATIVQQTWSPESRYVRFGTGLLGLIDPGQLLKLPKAKKGGSYVMVLNEGDHQVAFPADNVLGRKVLFVQPAPGVVNKADLLAGIALLDNVPVLVMDVSHVCREYHRIEAQSRIQARQPAVKPAAPKASAPRKAAAAPRLPVNTPAPPTVPTPAPMHAAR